MSSTNRIIPQYFPFWCRVVMSGVFVVMFSSPMLAQTSKPRSNQPCDTIQRMIIRDTIPLSFTRFGLGGDYAVPLVNAQFTGIPGIPSCCPGYGFSGGLAFGFGVFAEWALLQSIGVGAQVRMNIANLSFSRREYQPLYGLINIPLLYSLQTNTTSIDISPYIFWKPLESLTLQAGFSLSSYLPTAFTTNEKIDTAGLSFITNGQFSRTRNDTSGITSAFGGAVPSIRFGVNYELPLLANKTLFIAPEASFSLGLTDIVQNLQGSNPRLTFSAVRFGVTLRYSPQARLTEQQITQMQEQADEEYRRRLEECARLTKPVEKDVVIAKITSIQSISKEGVAEENPTINVEEFLASRSRYVLNTIFFAQQSSDISLRYRKIQPEDGGTFRIENLADAGVLQIYYQVLNIIGKRLTTNPKAEITLVGYADGLSEKNDKKLALERAEKVKFYLVNVWNIDENRIKVQTAMSRVPVLNDGDEIFEAEEQRKVEIQSNNKAILEELRFDYTLRIINPKLVRINFELASGSPLKQWSLEGSQVVQGSKKSLEDRTLFVTKGTTIPQAKFVDWDVTNPKQQPQSREAISVRISASDVNNYSPDSPIREIPVKLVSVADKEREGKADKRIDSYTLFSFAYGTNAPISGNADVQRIVAAIKQTLKPGAKVIVTGYTDTRGNEITNGILALQRANAVAGLIGYPNMTVNSEGATKINDNALPEGRFYNRFVQVDVETPLR